MCEAPEPKISLIHSGEVSKPLAYNRISDWKLRTVSGYALGKSIGAMGLSAGAGMRKIDFIAARWDKQRRKFIEITLSMSLAGIQLGVEKSKDLIESFTGAQVARYQPDKDSTGVLLNEKNPLEMKSSDFLGPCAMASFDVGKLSAGAWSGKLRGGSILYIGMNTTITDQRADWLQRVVDNADRATLGGNVMKFNAANLPWCNARAASHFDTNEVTVSMKAEASIALFSGEITAVGARQL